MLPLPSKKSVVNILVHKAVEAARQTNMTKLVLAGGVAANSSLEGHLQKACKENGLELLLPKQNLMHRQRCHDSLPWLLPSPSRRLC